MLAPDHRPRVHAALPVGELHPAQGVVVAPALHLPALPHHPAVVAGEDHDVVVVREVRLQGRREVAKGRVHRGLHAAEAPAALGDHVLAVHLPLVGRLVGVVVGVHCVVQKERLVGELVLVLQEERLRCLVEDLRVVLAEGALGEVKVGRARTRGVAHEGVRLHVTLVVVEFPRLVVGGLGAVRVVVVRIHEVSQVPVETAAHGRHLPGLPAHVPLADRVAHVTDRVEPLRNRGLVLAGKLVVDQQVVVAACEERGPGRRAPSLGVRGVDEDGLLRDGLDVGPAGAKVLGVLEVVEAQVVDEEEDDVRGLLGGRPAFWEGGSLDLEHGLGLQLGPARHQA
mmetsp:Transcript_58811/g.182678  ORF Transcript_58811/g.182678 Transcript_58811/m.182678 type:complete len:340 (-) Transcript_58811:280-1299(-)